MAVLYYKKIIAGELKLKDVPELWRKDVKKLIAQNKGKEE